MARGGHVLYAHSIQGFLDNLCLDDAKISFEHRV